jgi:hypothetical protein
MRKNVMQGEHVIDEAAHFMVAGNQRREKAEDKT